MKHIRKIAILALAATLALASGCQRKGQDYSTRLGEYQGLNVTASYRNDLGRVVRINYVNPITGSNEYVFATEGFEHDGTLFGGRFSGKFENIRKHNVSENSPLENMLSEKSLREAYQSANKRLK